jgi:hypothetical protein
MIITKKILADKISDYLNQKTSLSELVDWSENSLMDAEFEDENFDLIKNIISRLGLADVKEFCLSTEDYENYLKSLGKKDFINI